MPIISTVQSLKKKKRNDNDIILRFLTFENYFTAKTTYGGRYKTIMLRKKRRQSSRYSCIEYGEKITIVIIITGKSRWGKKLTVSRSGRNYGFESNFFFKLTYLKTIIDLQYSRVYRSGVRWQDVESVASGSPKNTLRRLKIRRFRFSVVWVERRRAP